MCLAQRWTSTATAATCRLYISVRADMKVRVCCARMRAHVHMQLCANMCVRACVRVRRVFDLFHPVHIRLCLVRDFISAFGIRHMQKKLQKLI